MKNKRILILIIIFIILVGIASFFIPVKSERGRWKNDDPIADVGHYMTIYYNIYGIKIKEK